MVFNDRFEVIERELAAFALHPTVLLAIHQPNFYEGRTFDGP